MTIDLKNYPILIVDDEQDNLDAFRFNFRKTFTVLTAIGGAEAIEILKDNDVAVVVSDQRMPKMTGLDMLKEVQEMRPDAVGIILTAFTDVDVLIEAINLGRIYRYITKPWDAKELRGVLVHAIERFRLVHDNRRMQDQLAQYTGYLNEEIHGAFDFGNIIGSSPALREVLDKVEQVGPTASTVLLRGETGTGKELVAHAIHINSPREAKPFVRVNCAALAPACSSPSCSVTRRAPLPARRIGGRAASSSPTAAPCSSTRSAICPWSADQAAPIACRSASSSASAAPRPSVRRARGRRPPTAISRK